jgi:hypothetical protein
MSKKTDYGQQNAPKKLRNRCRYLRLKFDVSQIVSRDHQNLKTLNLAKNTKD